MYELTLVPFKAAAGAESGCLTSPFVT